MRKWTHVLSRWLPAIAMMLIIFLFSSQPSDYLPDFEWLDRTIKKSGHMVGYALLSLTYWRAFMYREDRRSLAWILAVAYAVTDEFHQSFVPGRHPSLLDILVFDNFGSLLALWLASNRVKQKRPDTIHTIEAGR